MSPENFAFVAHTIIEILAHKLAPLKYDHILPHMHRWRLLRFCTIISKITAAIRYVAAIKYSCKPMKYCRKLTRLNIIMYASRNLFTSRGSCDVAVKWQVKQPSINVLLCPIAACLWVSAIFPIHEIDDILNVQTVASRKSRNFRNCFVYVHDDWKTVISSRHATFRVNWQRFSDHAASDYATNRCRIRVMGRGLSCVALLVNTWSCFLPAVSYMVQRWPRSHQQHYPSSSSSSSPQQSM